MTLPRKAEHRGDPLGLELVGIRVLDGLNVKERRTALLHHAVALIGGQRPGALVSSQKGARTARALHAGGPAPAVDLMHAQPGDGPSVNGRNPRLRAHLRLHRPERPAKGLDRRLGIEPHRRPPSVLRIGADQNPSARRVRKGRNRRCKTLVGALSTSTLLRRFAPLMRRASTPPASSFPTSDMPSSRLDKSTVNPSAGVHSVRSRSPVAQPEMAPRQLKL